MFCAGREDRGGNQAPGHQLIPLPILEYLMFRTPGVLPRHPLVWAGLSTFQRVIGLCKSSIMRVPHTAMALFVALPLAVGFDTVPNADFEESGAGLVSGVNGDCSATAISCDVILSASHCNIQPSDTVVFPSTGQQGTVTGTAGSRGEVATYDVDVDGGECMPHRQVSCAPAPASDLFTSSGGGCQNGELSSVVGELNTVTNLSIDSACPGDSGAGIFNEQGNLVGLATHGVLGLPLDIADFGPEEHNILEDATGQTCDEDGAHCECRPPCSRAYVRCLDRAFAIDGVQKFAAAKACRQTKDECMWQCNHVIKPSNACTSRD